MAPALKQIFTWASVVFLLGCPTLSVSTMLCLIREELDGSPAICIAKKWYGAETLTIGLQLLPCDTSVSSFEKFTSPHPCPFFGLKK